MEITRIEKPNLVDEVSKQLHELILSGTWSEGTKLASENELARKFCVSRVVIREALQLLRSEKLIVTRPGVGTYVANPSNYACPDHPINLSEDVYKRFLEFRDYVELGAVELSKTYALPEDYDRIDECVREMSRCSDDKISYSEADFAFHLAVVKCAHNDFLERAFLANRQSLTSVLLNMNTVPKSQGFGVTSHQQIADAIRRKDCKAVNHMYADMGKYNLARLSSFFKEKENE